MMLALILYMYDVVKVMVNCNIAKCNYSASSNFVSEFKACFVSRFLMKPMSCPMLVPSTSAACSLVSAFYIPLSLIWYIC